MHMVANHDGGHDISFWVDSDYFNFGLTGEVSGFVDRNLDSILGNFEAHGYGVYPYTMDPAAGFFKGFTVETINFIRGFLETIFNLYMGNYDDADTGSIYDRPDPFYDPNVEGINDDFVY